MPRAGCNTAMPKTANNKTYRTDRNYSSHKPHNSQASHSQNDDRLLRPRGDYQTLLSFQKAEIVYDITFRFAHKFLSRGDRTVDQMIQSARSGKKNILEGSKAALTSKETEIKLTNVARASLEELLDDYKDYLRARDLKIWDKDSKEASYVRSSAAKRRRLMKPAVSSSKPGRPKSSRISRSALSTRPII